MGLFVDGIDERDITDLRSNANKKSALDILNETKERLKNNTYRTKETVNYAYLGRKHGVVVPLGVNGSSDDYELYTPSVIKDGTTYKMWYGGNDGAHWRLHYATTKPLVSKELDNIGDDYLLTPSATLAVKTDTNNKLIRSSNTVIELPNFM